MDNPINRLMESGLNWPTYMAGIAVVVFIVLILATDYPASFSATVGFMFFLLLDIRLLLMELVRIERNKGKDES